MTTIIPLLDFSDPSAPKENTEDITHGVMRNTFHNALSPNVFNEYERLFVAITDALGDPEFSDIESSIPGLTIPIANIGNTVRVISDYFYQQTEALDTYKYDKTGGTITGGVVISGDFRVANNIVFVDTDTSRVGLGTNEPISTIDIRGDGYVSGNITVVGTINSNGDLVVPRSAGAAPTVDGQTAWDSSAKTLNIGTGSTTRTLVDTTSSQNISSKTISSSTITESNITGSNLTNIVSLVPSGDLNIGAHNLTASRFISSVAQGTSPLGVTSTTIVSNLNADMVDGYNAGNASGDIPISNGILNTDLNADMVDGYNAGNASGDIPISNGILNTDLNADQVDSCDVETYLTNSSSKIPRSDAVYAAIYRLGSTIRLEKTYTAISATNPWFCLSLPDQNWTTAHFSADFIAEMRARKVIYDEMGASPVSSFGGAWAGDTFTLTDNAANVAMITALAREYLYAGSPTTNWRLLHDGTNEFNIIAISVSARTIQVNLDSKTAAGSAIEIYRHRVYGSTTSARHFSEAGLGFYQAGGDKISGLRRLDQMQGHIHELPGATASGSLRQLGVADCHVIAGTTTAYVRGYSTLGDGIVKVMSGPSDDGTNGTPRTGTKTEIEAGTLLAYIYVGDYTE